MDFIDDIRDRLRRVDPLVLDIALALALTLIVCLQVWVFTSARPEVVAQRIPNFRPDMRPPARSMGFAYVLVAASFLPLVVRRYAPWLALAGSGLGALVYSLNPAFPPAPVVFGPMLALYTLASHATRRHTGLMALAVFGVVAAAPVFVFSSSVRWVAELVGILVLLAAAAIFGEAERNRREYLEEYQRRAEQAERSREEEARRRVDEERIRIARDVHDIVAHSLSIVAVQSGAALAQLDTDVDGARDSIDHVRSTSKHALAELRSMLDVLRTGDQDAPRRPTDDLSHLDTLISSVRSTDLAVDLDISGDLATVPAYANVSAYRIIQEALTNVVRHADAEAVRVVITAADSVLDIRVEDDGVGIAPEAVAAGGHGVRGMKERVEALGGEIRVRPLAGKGTAVHARIPLTRSTS